MEYLEQLTTGWTSQQIWIAVGVVALTVILYIIKNIVWAVRFFANYNNVLEYNLFKNEGERFLNMGLWTTVDLDSIHGDIDEILKQVEVAIEKGAEEGVNFKIAQTKMYELIFALSNLRRSNVHGIETGPGTGAHYLLWDKWGLQATMDQYEPFLEPAEKLLEAVPNLMEHAPASSRTGGLKGVKRYVKGSDDIGTSDEKVDCIMANESAFHYDNRAGYFKRCCESLKEGGTLVMTDLVANDELKVNCFMYWFWKWYMRCTLDFPVNTTYATFDQYKEHLNAAGFSEVRVVDITNLAIRPFYNNMTKIIHIPTNFRSLFIRVCWQINKTLNGLLASKDPTLFPIKYSLVVCKK